MRIYNYRGPAHSPPAAPVAILLLLALLLLALSISAAPRYAVEAKGKDQKLEYSISPGDNGTAKLPNMLASILSGILQTLEKSGIIQSLISTFTRMGGPSPEQPPLRVQAIRDKRNEGQSAPGQRPVQMMDVPLLGSKFGAEIEPSIDARPVTVLAKPPSTSYSPTDEWKRTLFGPSGLLTEIFNFINEKRIQDQEKRQTKGSTPSQADLPSTESNDFAKVLDTFLTKAKSGNFDEPLPEIPFLGICNRLSCGDIYKAMDEFRKSELFSNFQTAISLLHDQKGWDIIGELLANPDLVENFLGNGAGLQEFIKGKASSATTGNHGAKSLGEVKPDDGDLGVDFSHLKMGETSFSTDKGAGPIEIAGSVDSVPDYYSAIDGEKTTTVSQPERISLTGIARQTKESARGAVAPKAVTAIRAHNFVVPSPSVGRPAPPLASTLPDIMESIDEFPDEQETLTIEKAEKVSPVVRESHLSANLTLAPRGAWERKERRDGITGGQSSYQINTVLAKHPIRTTDNVSQSSTPSSRGPRTVSTGTRKASSSRAFVPLTSTTTMPLPSGGRKNYRRFDDYYSMYYDG